MFFQSLIADAISSYEIWHISAAVCDMLISVSMGYYVRDLLYTFSDDKHALLIGKCNKKSCSYTGGMMFSIRVHSYRAQFAYLWRRVQ